MGFAARLLDHQGSETPQEVNCPFCPALAQDRYEVQLHLVAALRDAYPVAEGHYLIVPLRHTTDFFGMTEAERGEADELLVHLASQLRHGDPSIDGFNVGMNCGPVAGQTVGHAHIHLIPRRRGDTPRPRGGVRGVIPEKMDY